MPHYKIVGNKMSKSRLRQCTKRISSKTYSEILSSRKRLRRWTGKFLHKNEDDYVRFRYSILVTCQVLLYKLTLSFTSSISLVSHLSGIILYLIYHDSSKISSEIRVFFSCAFSTNTNTKKLTPQIYIENSDYNLFNKVFVITFLKLVSTFL